MKNLLLTTALIALTAGPMFAQTTDATSPFRTAADQTEIYASDFIGSRLYVTETELDADEYDGMQTGWNDIGEVNDVILARDGSVEAVLVDIGGFLGIGERQVAVAMSSIRLVSDSATADYDGDYFLVMNGTQAMLESAPEYQRLENTAMTGDGTTGTMDATDTAVATGTAATGAIEGTGAMATDGTAPTDGSMATTDGMTDTNDVAGATDGLATTTTGDSQMAADGTVAGTGMQGETVERDGYFTAEPTYLTTEKLTGARVYDSTDAWVGDVSELVIDESGQITAAIVDVGGFLGMGAKPVALTMDDLDILRADNSEEVRVYVGMTREQLESMEAVAN